MKDYNDLKKLVTATEEDIIKFYEKGNQAAGARARKDLQAIKVLAQRSRMEIQAIKNK